jgi:hypothetical protein
MSDQWIPPEPVSAGDTPWPEHDMPIELVAAGNQPGLSAEDLNEGWVVVTPEQLTNGIQPPQASAPARPARRGVEETGQLISDAKRRSSGGKQ